MICLGGSNSARNVPACGLGVPIILAIHRILLLALLAAAVLAAAVHQYYRFFFLDEQWIFKPFSSLTVCVMYVYVHLIQFIHPTGIKVKYLRGTFQWSRSLRWPDFPCPLEPVTYPFGGSAITNTTDNLSEKYRLKLTEFCLFLYHRSYTILQGPLIPPMTFTSCHDRGSNLLPQMGEPAL